jgi:hypothetical protein
MVHGRPALVVIGLVMCGLLTTALIGGVAPSTTAAEVGHGNAGNGLPVEIDMSRPYCEAGKLVVDIRYENRSGKKQRLGVLYTLTRKYIDGPIALPPHRTISHHAWVKGYKLHSRSMGTLMPMWRGLAFEIPMLVDQNAYRCQDSPQATPSPEATPSG